VKSCIGYFENLSYTRGFDATAENIDDMLDEELAPSAAASMSSASSA